MADYSFEDAPDFDVTADPRRFRHQSRSLERYSPRKNRSDEREGGCDGNGLHRLGCLARTGLLDGRPATSNKVAWDWVLEQGPKVDWKRQARWVDDGDIVTSSGVSAGIDMALDLIARLRGEEIAVNSAKYMEYIWNRDPANDPFA